MCHLTEHSVPSASVTGTSGQYALTKGGTREAGRSWIQVPREQASLWGGQSEAGVGLGGASAPGTAPPQAWPLEFRGVSSPPPPHPAFSTPSGLVTVSSFVVGLTGRTSGYTGSWPGLPPNKPHDFNESFTTAK